MKYEPSDQIFIDKKITALVKSGETIILNKNTP